MSEQNFMLNVANHVSAISLCLENRLQIPALVLVYCCVDFMGALARPAEKVKHERADFVAWAERYMECEKRLNVSGIDLYSARCGILHTYTGESELLSKRRAKRIVYAWGNEGAEEPNAFFKEHEATFKENNLGAVVVKIEMLAQVLCDGIAAFSDKLHSDPNGLAVLERRASQMFANYSSFPGMEPKSV